MFMPKYENDNDLLDFIMYYRELSKEARMCLLGFMQGIIAWDSSIRDLRADRNKPI